MNPNYFTCTLGEAAKHRLANPEFTNINSFLEFQAQCVPQQPAVGFFQPQNGAAPWATQILSFRDIRDISLNLAAKLSSVPELKNAKTVALLCPSSPEFMFIWLALIRLDITVLLLAPQCQPDAIVHLCKECDATALLYDRIYGKAAEESVALASELRGGENGTFGSVDIAKIVGQDVWELIREHNGHDDERYQTKNGKSKARLDDVAYIHHTSGTSSGLPKPIPQPHSAAVGALPSVPNGKDKATFTTTPLYHGGVADVFRSWTSGALIWVYPGKDVPITATNIVKALDAAAEAAEACKLPPIKYFSCVPYVLQLLEEEQTRGLDWLRKMDIVGVGGAALSVEVGDHLVENGVNLVSRFGSSECGFLMSSHRDYAKDKLWQFLRDNVGSEFLRFEQKEDGLSELVVLPRWPHRAKKNCEDGSFVTSDLFEPHPTIPNAWRYHSRADSQLTLITGKKFDPAPLEGALADSKLVADVFIFGNGKPYPGVLLFRSAAHKEVSDHALIEKLWPMMGQLNSRSQDHARITQNMIRPMAWQKEPLEKSSKGTLLRSKVEARFAEVIEQAYSETNGVVEQVLSYSDVEAAALKVVEQTIGRSERLGLDTDLFAYGVDSIAAMRIRGRLQALAGKDKALPATIVEDCGTIRKICQFLIDLRKGKGSQGSDNELQLMWDLVDQYSHFEDADQPSNSFAAAEAESREVVLLTGATGALGTHVLDLCARNSRVRKIVCLIRGEDDHAARERLNKALDGRRLAPVKASSTEIVVLPAKLSQPKLGLNEKLYDTLAREVTVIVHLAWEVNFRMNLRSFRSNSIAGVTNLLNLAVSSPGAKPPRFAYCSSVASVMNLQGNIPEEASNDPKDASPLGYSRSKWVAEQICKRADSQTRLQGRVSVFRVGQLAGDSKTGIWNEKEAWPMMLSTVRLTKTVPEIKDEPLNWLPVDIAAQALVEATVERAHLGDEMEVVHVLNQHRSTTWMDLLGWLKKEVDFEVVSPQDWTLQLQELEAQGKEHPAFKLIGHWRDTLCKNCGGEQTNEASSIAPHFETIRSVRAAPVLADMKPVDEVYFMKIWKWIDASL